MDDIVIRGMARWPDVPAVYGWLALDRRGAWLLKGERITNPSVTAFIGRNYLHDERGRWFFQNGPQRVFVDLEYTPLVYRVLANAAGALEAQAHTGERTAEISGAWLDEEGSLLLESPLGIGVVHDRDLDVLVTALADASGSTLGDEELEARLHALHGHREATLRLRGFAAEVRVEPIRTSDVARRFGFAAHPQAHANAAPD